MKNSKEIVIYGDGIIRLGDELSTLRRGNILSLCDASEYGLHAYSRLKRLGHRVGKKKKMQPDLLLAKRIEFVGSGAVVGENGQVVLRGPSSRT